MEVTLFTKETAPHASMHILVGTDEQIEKNRAAWAAHALDPSLPHPGLCGNCDWKYIRSDKKYKKEREAMQASLFQFQRKGKLPPMPRGIKFGGAGMSDAEARKVVLPRIPLSPCAGDDSFLNPEDLMLKDALETYLTAVNKARPKTYVVEESVNSARGYYASRSLTKTETRRWRCGCTMTRAKYQGSDWGSWQKGEICTRHRGAVHGRDEKTGEIYED